MRSCEVLKSRLRAAALAGVIVVATTCVGVSAAGLATDRDGGQRRFDYIPPKARTRTCVVFFFLNHVCSIFGITMLGADFLNDVVIVMILGKENEKEKKLRREYGMDINIFLHYVTILRSQEGHINLRSPLLRRSVSQHKT